MTEAEWISCIEPGPMLEFLRTRFNARKARLFGCGYLHLIWQRLDGKEGSCQAVTVAERFADAEATAEELREARRIAEATAEAWSDPAFEEPVWQAVDTASEDAWAFFERVHYETTGELAEPDIVNPRTWRIVKERRAARHGLYIQVLRDIFGNPFRPLSPRPEAIAPLAEQIYSGAWDTMPLLGEWLQEHGYRSEGEHCLDPNIHHVKSCWVVDWATGRE
jgi:hypothetical protein